MNYLFDIATGYMTLRNANKRHLKVETTIDETDESPFPKRIVTPLNEIRSSDLEFDTATETLQIVDDEVVVVPSPAVAPVVPKSVTNYQLRQALNESPEDRAAVDALINSSDDPNIKDGWEHASEFKSDNALFVGAVTYLGWSQEKVDDLLILASTFK
jgi:hypothetical protein